MNKEQAIEIIETHSDDISSSSLLGQALNMAIDALKAQLPNEGTTKDAISRQATIDAVNNAFDRETLLTGFVRSIAVRAIRDMPTIQPEPSIPLTWIGEQIERLRGMDNAFATLTAMQISGMVKKWRREQNETD